VAGGRAALARRPAALRGSGVTTTLTTFQADTLRDCILTLLDGMRLAHERLHALGDTEASWAIAERLVDVDARLGEALDS